MDCKVYVGDLGYGAAKQELEDVFSKYGPLRNVWVARNPPGFAFVEFEDPRDAEDATRALDGTRMNGRRVRVEMSTGRSRRGGRRPLPSSGGPRYGGSSSSSSNYSRDRYRKRSRSYSPRRRSRSYSRSRSRSPSRERRRSISRERRGRSGSQDPFGRNVARGKSPEQASRRRSYSRSRSKSPAWKSSAKSRSVDRSRSRSNSRSRGVNGLNGDNRD